MAKTELKEDMIMEAETTEVAVVEEEVVKEPTKWQRIKAILKEKPELTEEELKKKKRKKVITGIAAGVAAGTLGYLFFNKNGKDNDELEIIDLDEEETTTE